MTSKARSQGTNKEHDTASADADISAQAEREDAHGPADVYLLAGGEFDSICEQLRELTHVVIDAWATQDGFADGLERVLIKLHAARRNLETAVEAQVQP